MSKEDIRALKDALPSVFDNRTLPASFDETLIVIPIDDVENVAVNDSNGEDPQDSVSTGEDLEGLIDDERTLDGGVFPSTSEPPSLPVGVVSQIGGGFGGAPVTPLGGGSPPTDCLAFYLPFHYFYPNDWGIYILVEGVDWLARQVVFASGGGVSRRDAIKASRLFLYYHESFHHKTECFATRLEVTHRMPFYKVGFENLYRKNFLTDNCLEEGLAEATALMNVSSKLKNPAIDRALELIVLRGPAGYRRGVEFARSFKSRRADFAEENQQECLPSLPTLNSDVWNNANYMFSGISNVKSRVNYVISKGHPLASRVPFRPRFSPDNLVRKLRRLCGLQFQRHGHRHDIYVTAQGNQVSIPRHSKDLGDGLVKSILVDAGLTMSLHQFVNA